MSYIIIFIKLLYYIVEDVLYYLLKSSKRFSIILLFFLSVYCFIYFSTEDYTEYPRVEVRIPPKSSFQNVVKILDANDLIESAFLFKQFSKYIGYDRKVKSGEYEIPSGLNSYNLVNFLIEAKPKLRKLTIIEGLKFKNIVPEIAGSLNLDSAKLANLFSDSLFLKNNDIKAKSLEGYILPQTYLLAWGKDEESILKFLIQKNKAVLNKYSDEIKKQNKTLHEILTMASIIQGECIYEDEMATVSSVYWNRIRIGMKLGADPTIQYFLDKPTRLRIRHLRIDHPYNTYMYEGLPPGPINNPGEAAIKAAIFPEKTNYLYFVADGTGKHIFGKTYAEHNENRKTLDKIRLELWREKRYGKKK